MQRETVDDTTELHYM